MGNWSATDGMSPS